MRFLLDHRLRADLVTWLQHRRHHAVRLSDIMAKDSDDFDVAAMAKARGELVLTFDGDFGNIVNFPPHQFGGIVLLMMRDNAAAYQSLLDQLDRLLKEHAEQDWYVGRTVVVDTYRFRWR